VGDSQKKVVPRMEVYEDDGPWMWLAFAPDSRLIVAFTIGPRKQRVADELVKLTDDCLSENKPVFVTDGLDLYKVALLNHYGLQIEYPKTGKRGRPKKPKIVPFDDLKYAQVVKKRKGGKLQKVERNVIFGEDIEQSAISTSLIERQNLTFRQDNNRVSRKTIGFSKIAKWLVNHMKIYCTHFNFCRGHGGLKYKDDRGVECKNTPARQAGITDSKWTLRNLLTFKCFKTPII
jgi:IS1 family transposase